MRIYLDHNATTPIDPAVLERYRGELLETFGNASSIHEEGQRARRKLEEARDTVAAAIGAPPRQLVFTSGGTESNNLALFGVAGQEPLRRHLVVSAIEHPSVLEVARELERRGWELTVVGCDARGVVQSEEVRRALRDDTVMVALMLGNNETGAVQPVSEVARICRERGVHLHCDAVQAMGKLRFDVEALGVDTLSFSGHKLHAPKGIGALYVRSGLTLHAVLRGGAQERRRRAGTENVPLAVAFAVALQQSDLHDSEEVKGRRDRFEALITEATGAVVNSGSAERLPNTSNLLFPGADAEGIVIGLDLAGVAASTGSACSSGRVEPSHVLLAMGLSMEDAKSSVRFSLSRFTTDDEIERAASLVAQIVPLHRRAARATLVTPGASAD